MNTRVWKFQDKVLRNLRANRAEGKECLRKLLNEKLGYTFRQIFFSWLDCGSRPPHFCGLEITFSHTPQSLGFLWKSGLPSQRPIPNNT